MAVNAQAKIALPPLEFDEFNALDVLVNGEIAESLYRLRTRGGGDRETRLLERLRAVRSKIDAVRPPAYAQAIRAARAESVCDT
jgi:hypothetical protein